MFLRQLLGLNRAGCSVIRNATGLDVMDHIDKSAGKTASDALPSIFFLGTLITT